MNWEIYVQSRSNDMEKLCSLLLALSHSSYYQAVLFWLSVLKGGEK